MSNNFKTNLRYYRHKYQLTQKQAAENMGLSRSRLNSYELGVAEPGIEILLLIKAVYCVDTLDALVCANAEEEKI